jgi:dihydrofolate reductase
MIIMIAAASGNNVIGKDNDMIWRLPDDFKRFKALTSGHSIIMGRKTFESLPGILPNRTHVIVTRNKDYKVDGCEVESSLIEALVATRTENDVFIIGGGEIYKQGMELADKIELTRVHANFEGDTFFPEINLTKWKLVNEEFHDRDLKHQYSFTYQTYERI